MSLEKALLAIEAQQPKQRNAVWMVGEQLKDMLRAEPGLAEIVEQDLAVKAMSLAECEKKIKAYADKHRTGNFACVTPAEAEKIIREYFGLTEIPERAEAGPQKETAAEGKVIDLADFF